MIVQRPIRGVTRIPVSSLAVALSHEATAVFLAPHGARHPCAWPAGPYRRHVPGDPRHRCWQSGIYPMLEARHHHRTRAELQRAWGAS